MTTASDHSLFEDIQALVSGTLLFAFAIVLFRHAGLLTGGTAGLAFLGHYASDVSFGLLYFLINIPFYIFGLLALGRAFTLKTFAAVALLSLYSEVLPRWIHIESIHPVFAAVIGGLLAGAGSTYLLQFYAERARSKPSTPYLIIGGAVAGLAAVAVVVNASLF